MTTTIAGQVEELRAVLAEADIGQHPGELVDLLSGLEALKDTACAPQADAAVALDAGRRLQEAELGVPARRRGRGVASEIALARRESPNRGQKLLSLAKMLRTEMPNTLARSRAGELSEWRAMVLARETACLTREHREAVDAELCDDPATLAGVGTGELVARVRSRAVELDQGALVERAKRAENERRVSIRPAPDTMCYLTALLPVGQGVAAYAALTKDAEAMGMSGDPRGKGQLMADLLTARAAGLDLPEPADPAAPPGTGTGSGAGASTGTRTGSGAGVGVQGPPAAPDVPGPPAVPVTVNITLSDTALLAGGHDPALVGADGVPPQAVPAAVARLLVASTLDSTAAAWIRRLYTDPGGQLVALTSKQRFFPRGLGDYLALRDAGTCRTPYCDAPIRHLDHITPVDADGETTSENGKGACVACNHAKQAPGWREEVPDRPTHTRHTVRTRTPTGHTYYSVAPSQPGTQHRPAGQQGPASGARDPTAEDRAA
ncbi:HNH endonuclease signature motif containing protein [Georgenia halophila]|uniref:HNH endonuclease signature motif containing protein n=1 Tax=Georgenia halophila TaxID=620889 RepID=A0ABP8LKV2_9MICO